MSDKKVAIEQMILRIGKKEIPLSLSEAKELHQVLGELFKTETIVKEKHYYDYGPLKIYPFYHPSYPYRIESNGFLSITKPNTGTSLPHPNYEVWCSSNNNVSLSVRN